MLDFICQKVLENNFHFLQESTCRLQFFLPRDINHFYMGCYRCIEDDTGCPYYEEKRKITEAIEKANLLVFTTPTYCLRTSAPMNWEGVGKKKKEKIEKDITKLAKKVVRAKKVRVGMKLKFIFNMMGNMQKAGWGSSPVEKRYWSEQGWLDKKRPWKREYFTYRLALLTTGVI